MLTTIEKIQQHARGDESVRPGMPAKFTTACQPGDIIWQGDLGLEIVEHVPKTHKKANQQSVKLVPGDTQGARHCLDSLNGVTIYVTDEQDDDSLVGPCFVLTDERTVLHPTHGPVTIPAGFTILCHYQREWDKESSKERRQRD